MDNKDKEEAQKASSNYFKVIIGKEEIRKNIDRYINDSDNGKKEKIRDLINDDEKIYRAVDKAIQKRAEEDVKKEIEQRRKYKAPTALERNIGYYEKDRRLYQERKQEDNNDWQEVKKYKKPKKNVTLKKAWKGFVIGLCFVGLGASMKIAYDIGKSLEDNPIENNTDKDLKEKKLRPNEVAAKAYFFQYKDQEYLNLISNGTHEEWEALPDNIKDWIRDPDRVKEAEEKRKAREEEYDSESDSSFTNYSQSESQESNIIILDDDDYVVESENTYDLNDENEPEFEVTIEDSYVYNPEENDENIIIIYDDSDNERE